MTTTGGSIGAARRTALLLTAVVLIPGGAGAGCTNEPSPAPPDPDRRSDWRAPRRLDDYVLVGPNGATAFTSPPAQPVGAVGAPLAKGFGFLTTGETRTVGGGRYVQIYDGRWLAETDVDHARPSRLTGAHLAPGEPLHFAWALLERTPVLAAPNTAAAVIATRPRYARLALAGPCRATFCPLAVGWVRQHDVAQPTLAPRPTAVGPREAWVDIDLASQTLVAYEGDEPRFATLVSTGIGGPASPLGTPTGTFRIRSKHDVVRMDNLEHTGVEPYAYDVPLTQYFSDGKALHAALWHDQFGHPRSHGCVNLSPDDARWLFAFTSPVLGPGAPTVVATAGHPGTLVRVRGEIAPPRPPSAPLQPAERCGRPGVAVATTKRP